MMMALLVLLGRSKNFAEKAKIPG